MSENTAVFEFIASRRSLKPKLLTEPSPTDAQFARAAQAAMRAPDHGSLVPYRFVRVESEDRGRLADVFEAAAKRQGADADKQARSRSKALKGPSLVGFVFSPDTECGISLDEQFLTAGAALDQFMLALSALGFGGIVLSGSVLADDGVQAFFCRKPGENSLPG